MLSFSEMIIHVDISSNQENTETSWGNIQYCLTCLSTEVVTST